MKKNKFQLKRESTYIKLVEAGMKCFLDKGYAATTLGDIVAVTGHTKGAFYGHFESKEQLFLHIMDYRQQLSTGWTNIPKQYNSADTTLEEVMVITLTQLSEMWEGGADYWIMVLIDFYQQTKHNPDIHNIFKEKYRGWVAEIEAFVDVLKECGWISHHLESHLVAMQLISFNEGFAMTSTLFGSSNPRALLQGMVKLLV